jgi:DNA polymerase (family X)
MTLDNIAIARILGEIADLLEIRGENPFKIRAYRNAVDIVAHAPEGAGNLDEAALRAWGGIGKDLAARIVEIARTGTCQIHAELLAEFPPTLLDLLRLQGVGPKTVTQLYRELSIRSVEDLEQAITAGRIRELKGMGSKKEQLLLKALTERKQHAGRHLLADADAVLTQLLAWLRESQPEVEFIPVGSYRRGAETIGDLDILAIGAGANVMDTFVTYRLVERVLGRGDTKSSVLLLGGYQADLRLIPAASRGAAMQYFTGSKAHNIALRDRALERGLRLNEYGLFRAEDMVALAGETEDGIYQALGLAWVPPELRQNRGEIEAAEAGTLPSLIEATDIRGDLHMHTTETDGKDDLETMVRAARERGLEYIAITDHSKALAMANGLDEARVRSHAQRIRKLNDRTKGITVLAGIECDIMPDGRMDLADDCLAELDIVIGSVHSAHQQDEAAMTARLLRAIENPYVDIIGHPTGRQLLRREPSRFDIEAVCKAAAQHGVALEINCNPLRLDLSDANARLAQERGVRIVISTDAHSTKELDARRWGILTARRAWAAPGNVLNTLPVDQFRQALRRNRK